MPFTYERTIHFADTDAAGVVFFANYLRLCHEAYEEALAAAGGNKTEIAAESADVLYHLMVLWAACGLTPDDIYAVLASREGQSGIEEKASRPTG